MKDEERDLQVVIHPSSFLLHPCFWWSELESNQPFGFFRPALIHLSYPTEGIADCQFSIVDLKFNFLTIGNWHLAIGNAVKRSSHERPSP